MHEPPGLPDTAQDRRPESRPLAFVVPRYGLEFVGGAEGIARQFAEALHRTGVPVEVLTTCTNDLSAWNNYYQPGATIINGVPVRRFPVDATDIALYNRLAAKAFTSSEPLTYHEQQLFVQQGINSQQLYGYLQQHAEHYRCCIVTPYLYGTTYHAAQVMKDRTIHIPCLHDECFAYFDIFREMLEEARGILFNAPEEEHLARKLGILNPFSAVVGCAFDPPTPGNPQRVREQYNLGDTPFLLYSGRFEPHKNVPLLIDYFLRYKQERTAPLRLVLAGRGPLVPPDHPDIVDIGFFSPGTMNDILAAALALVQLSVHESFSLVIMEAWLQGRPAIVHRDCPVTRGHVERSGGGWVIGTYEEFAAALDAMLASPEVVEQHGAAGKQYVTRVYSWETILPKFHEAITSFMAPRSLYQVLSQRGRRRALEFTSARYEERLRDLVAQVLPEPETANTYLARLDALQGAAKISRPNYRVRSRLPVVGRLISWIRVQLTSHLREPYLDPIVQQQERFNLAIQRHVSELARTVWRLNKQADMLKLREQKAQIAELQARVAQLEAQLASRDGTLPSLDGPQRKADVLQVD